MTGVCTLDVQRALDMAAEADAGAAVACLVHGAGGTDEVEALTEVVERLIDALHESQRREYDEEQYVPAMEMVKVFDTYINALDGSDVYRRLMR